MPTDVRRQTTIKVWDSFVRLFHWSLATSFAVAWLTAGEWRDLHEWAGYSAAALIALRVVWGITGPRYARFAQFLRSPVEVLRYLAAMLRSREPRHLGHNPAGGFMILALLLTMAATAATGWMFTLDAFWGVQWVEEAHELLANLLLALVLLHVAGVLFASVHHRENLVRAMVTGRKRSPAPGDVA